MVLTKMVIILKAVVMFGDFCCNNFGAGDGGSGEIGRTAVSEGKGRVVKMANGCQWRT